MAGPLDGVRVLEVASFISGPYAAMLLADLGAEVIKVEPPGTGDPFRGWGERQGGERPQFAAYNRGKKSVTLDLRNDLARRTYLALVKRADVVVENFRPGTAERMGIADATLREGNPRLVYCAMTGVGSSGPASHRPIYDAIGQALSGLWSVLTDLDDPEPIGPPMSDQLTGAGFATKADRVKSYDALRATLEETFRTRARAEWLARLERCDVPAAPINDIAEAVADPQARHIGMVRTFGSGDRARRLVGFPVAFAATPGEPGLPPPDLGEHTNAVLAELGHDGSEDTPQREGGAIS